MSAGRYPLNMTNATESSKSCWTASTTSAPPPFNKNACHHQNTNAQSFHLQALWAKLDMTSGPSSETLKNNVFLVPFNTLGGLRGKHHKDTCNFLVWGGGLHNKAFCNQQHL